MEAYLFLKLENKYLFLLKKNPKQNQKKKNSNNKN